MTDEHTPDETFPREFGFDESVPEELRDDYVRPEFAAQVLGRDVSAVLRWLRQKKMPGVRVTGKAWLIKREVLAHWELPAFGNPWLRQYGTLTRPKGVPKIDDLDDDEMT